MLSPQAEASPAALAEFASDPRFEQVKGVVYDTHTGGIKKCLFCDIIDKKEPGVILLENHEFTVFKTIKPAVSTLHALVCPRQHIKNVAALNGQRDAEMLTRMVDAGRQVLSDLSLDVDDVQFCFHAPPYNSIDHLHLHVIATPHAMHDHMLKKYTPGQWFYISVEDAQSMCCSRGRSID